MAAEAILDCSLLPWQAELGAEAKCDTLHSYAPCGSAFRATAFELRTGLHTAQWDTEGLSSLYLALIIAGMVWPVRLRSCPCTMKLDRMVAPGGMMEG